jgi:hypothetical protein
LYPQSLAELAEKEKVRRAQFKGKSSIVLTNADLEKTKKRSALTTNSPNSDQKSSTLRSPSNIRSFGQNTSAIRNEDQVDQREPDRYSKKYATKVLETTARVQDSALSLYKPDGNFAKIEYLGFLDLELEAENKKGADIAVYAKRQQSGILPSTLNYALFVMNHDGEWEYIGTGSGIQSRETFELGEIPKTHSIRLVFRDYTDTNTIKRLKPHLEEYYMEIDAVENLHF